MAGSTHAQESSQQAQDASKMSAQEGRVHRRPCTWGAQAARPKAKHILLWSLRAQQKGAHTKREPPHTPGEPGHAET